MADKIERKDLTIEDVLAALPGLHFVQDCGRDCLNCYDAVRFLSWLNSRPVDVHYLSSPIQRGKLHPVRMGTHNLYLFDELKLLVVRATRGRPAESTLNQKAKDAISSGQRRRWDKVKEKASAG